MIEVKIDKYNLEVENLGFITASIEDFATVSDPDKIIKDWVVLYRFNNRQWSASTKTRSEVAHSTKKIRQQKGSGRARAGGITAPQRVGGGRVGTPRPKFDQHKTLNKKEARKAFCLVCADAFESKTLGINSFDMEAPKTSVVAKFLKGLSSDRRPLFVYSDSELDSVKNFSKSVSNLQKVRIEKASCLNVYDILLCHKMIVTESATQALIDRIKSYSCPGGVSNESK
ncbi:MAG: 50S ribosomal protein L4 [Chlamydiia bacterium]|nr:50S ribosomal protein L4 [Chlamydiia bacterium]